MRAGAGAVPRRAGPAPFAARRPAGARAAFKSRGSGAARRGPGGAGAQGAGGEEAGESPAVAPGMTKHEALELLGVAEDASFDQILRRKEQLLLAAGRGGAEFDRAAVEAAYDLLLSSSLSRRLAGEVSSSVRYADVPPKKSVTQVAAEVLAKVPGGGVAVEQAPRSKAGTQNVVFAVLAAWTLAQGFLPGADLAGGSAIPVLQLGVAGVTSCYFLRENKGAGLGRAAVLTAAGLAAGCLVGGLLEGLVHVEAHPLGQFHSPGVLVGEAGVFGIWAACALLA